MYPYSQYLVAKKVHFILNDCETVQWFLDVNTKHEHSLQRNVTFDYQGLKEL